MALASAIPEDAWLRLRQVGRVDLVVGIPSFNNDATIGHVIRTVAAGMAKYFPDAKPLIVHSDGGSTDGTPQVIAEISPLVQAPVVSFVYQGIPGKGTALRAVFEAAERLSAQACVLLDADLRSVSPEWIDLLAGPIVREGCDYVAPMYVRHKYDGTITNNLAYPLTRALYGVAVRQPIGGDFGISGELASEYLSRDVWQTDVARFGIDIFMTTVAIVEGFTIGQSRLGAKIHDVKDPAATLGPMFVQVLGTLFALMETYQAVWRRVKGSKPTTLFGEKREIMAETVSVTVSAMIDRFRAGAQTFADTWSRTLSRGNYEKVMGLAGQSGDRFDFPTDLWARVVFDFAAAYHNADRLAIERSAIVGALTPLYYGRTARVVIESAEMDEAQFERLVENQAGIFEKEKSYLLKRWQA
ncbi:MAG: glycosyltransferase [Chloroflexi bacterium]|nr:glycosyltransferase [Chloroflexota bacterium]